MLADPFGNRVVAGQSPKRGQGRVEFLVEVCDPSEADEFGYTVNGILVSDFYTPHFFDPVKAPRRALQLHGRDHRRRARSCKGGYISWHDPRRATTGGSRRWFGGAKPEFRDLGVFDAQHRQVAALLDRRPDRASRASTRACPRATRALTAAVAAGEETAASATPRRPHGASRSRNPEGVMDRRRARRRTGAPRARRELREAIQRDRGAGARRARATPREFTEERAREAAAEERERDRGHRLRRREDENAVKRLGGRRARAASTCAGSGEVGKQMTSSAPGLLEGRDVARGSCRSSFAAPATICSAYSPRNRSSRRARRAPAPRRRRRARSRRAPRARRRPSRPSACQASRSLRAAPRRTRSGGPPPIVQPSP